MHVVQLVVKNASELDFSLPVLWDLRRRELAQVTIVYCVADRSQILRDSDLYRDVLGRLGVRQVDFGDRLPLRHPVAKALWRRATGKPASDRHSVRQSLAALRSRSLGLSEHLTALRHLSRGGVDVVLRRAQHVALRSAHIANLLPELSPDVVLLGNRSFTRFPHRSAFFAELSGSGRPVVLVPHAAHETIRDEFTPFDEEGDPLPDFVDYWLVLNQVETPSRFPGREQRFSRVGNPCLDREWAGWLRSVVRSDVPTDGGPCRRTLVVIGRKFVAQGAPTPDDPFTLAYSEMRDHLASVAAGVAGSGHPYRVVLKAHPSTNRVLLSELLADLLLPWDVSFDPAGALFAGATAVTGMFSTALVMAVPFGCTVIPIASRVQDFVDDRWVVMKELYRGFESFVDDSSALANELRAAAGRVVDEDGPTSEQAHIARFFPGGSLRRCSDRVLELGA